MDSDDFFRKWLERVEPKHAWRRLIMKTRSGGNTVDFNQGGISSKDFTSGIVLFNEKDGYAAQERVIHNDTEVVSY